MMQRKSWPSKRSPSGSEQCRVVHISERKIFVLAWCAGGGHKMNAHEEAAKDFPKVEAWGAWFPTLSCTVVVVLYVLRLRTRFLSSGGGGAWALPAALCCSPIRHYTTAGGLRCSSNATLKLLTHTVASDLNALEVCSSVSRRAPCPKSNGSSLLVNKKQTFPVRNFFPSNNRPMHTIMDCSSNYFRCG